MSYTFSAVSGLLLILASTSGADATQSNLLPKCDPVGRIIETGQIVCNGVSDQATDDFTLLCYASRIAEPVQTGTILDAFCLNQSDEGSDVSSCGDSLCFEPRGKLPEIIVTVVAVESQNAIDVSWASVEFAESYSLEISVDGKDAVSVSTEIAEYRIGSEVDSITVLAVDSNDVALAQGIVVFSNSILE